MIWNDQTVITGHPGLSPGAKRKMLGENALRLCPRLRE
jgi:hypothetical protein